VAVIECVPNVSEGRRAEVIDACAEAIRAAGPALLDVSADADHHRTVFTFAGSPEAVRAGALALFDAALPRIDLRRHRGVHPRLGAVDVVPFVPLEDATMADCVAIAREVAATVAARHALPVFLYEAAAATPERRRLEGIRRGGFERLAARLGDPAWTPDFGPARPHATAGASVVGARPVLIAYNITLATDRLAVAKAVAAAVRESSGGLPHVKAMGVPLAGRGLVQVSMNLTRHRATTLHAVMARVVEEAARRGVEVHDSEIIGLAPADALWPSAAADLRIDPARLDERVLERRLGGRLIGGV